MSRKTSESANQRGRQDVMEWSKKHVFSLLMRVFARTFLISGRTAVTIVESRHGHDAPEPSVRCWNL